ncbi:hypothetical protein [Polyangium mundeleinium]|uniref:Lipoprotein n=1 Tax=Polyangium mundeleinium TaxID=2995306 RepID=A0ABT5EGZ1_9BACT|nr:hypothetical protein [Polyangium mundeleinium]MDC0741092.1 hypothetical protein [Polyangium mundeleinium]
MLAKGWYMAYQRQATANLGNSHKEGNVMSTNQFNRTATTLIMGIGISLLFGCQGELEPTQADDNGSTADDTAESQLELNTNQADLGVESDAAPDCWDWCVGGCYNERSTCENYCIRMWGNYDDMGYLTGCFQDCGSNYNICTQGCFFMCE